MGRIKPAHIVVAVVVIVVAALVIPQMLAEQPGARTVQEGVVSETIGVVETNATAVYQVQMLEGSDPEHESEHIFGALTGLPGVGTATLDTVTLELTVAYDDARITDVPIRDALVESGYIVPTRDDATQTELADDESVQRISITDDGTRFDPFLIRAKAGVPIEMEFAPGQECRVVVKFPELGIEQDISEGGTVTLPALEPGEYQIACGQDGPEGTVIVE